MRWIVIVCALLLLGAGAFLMQSLKPEDTSCHGRLRPGPNSNTSRLTTTLQIEREQWPAVAQIFRDFAGERNWSFRDGVGSKDPTFHWLEMCDDAKTTVRAGNTNGGDRQIGFDIVHMDYVAPGRDGWKIFYRDLHRRLEARWPGRMHYVEGEFGQTIARPDWLGPVPDFH